MSNPAPDLGGTAWWSACAAMNAADQLSGAHKVSDEGTLGQDILDFLYVVMEAYSLHVFVTANGREIRVSGVMDATKMITGFVTNHDIFIINMPDGAVQLGKFAINADLHGAAYIYHPVINLNVNVGQFRSGA